MSDSPHTPVVPLEAGAGPDNPPCPACGEPLFGWLTAQPGLAGPISRCESCGLGVVGADASPEEALRELDRHREGETIVIVNRAGFACSLGGVCWSGLAPGSRYLFTVEAVRRLVARRDQVVKSARWTPGRSFRETWQTLLNSLTLGRNVALAALDGGDSVPAAKPWQRKLDAVVSVVLAVPAAVVAALVEAAGAPFGRGAAIAIRTELL